MSKGLDIINLYEDSNYLNTFHPNFMKDLQIVKKDLQRLEAIDNANPSEALKCVDVLKEDGCITTLYQGKALETIRQSLLKAQEIEKENEFLSDTIATSNQQYTNLMLTYQEQKRVLEIIKEKEVNLGMLKTCKTVEQYNAGCRIFGRNELIQEEFDLLKKWSEEK